MQTNELSNIKTLIAIWWEQSFNKRIKFNVNYFIYTLTI